MDTNELMDLINQFQTMNKEYNNETDEELDSYINQLKKLYGDTETTITYNHTTTGMDCPPTPQFAELGSI